jgi:RNA polymerase sigma-70 factor (ECF subfamily)
MAALDHPSRATTPVAPETDVGRIFARLQPRERALLWLAYVEGRSHAEIAQAMGLRAISVRVMLFRARAALARRLRRAGVPPTECFDASR